MGDTMPDMDDPPTDPADPAAVASPEPAEAPPSTGRARSRTVIAAVIGVVAVLVLSVTIVAVWAKATVLRSERVAALAGDALAEPEVQTALAAYLTDQVSASVDLDDRLTALLPDALDRFSPVIADAATTAVERGLTRVLSDEDVQRILQATIQRAWDRALRILEGDGLTDGVTITDDQVSLNLLPLVGRGLSALQSVGVLQDVEIPPLTVDGDPAEQIAALSSALGRDLPTDFAQLVVYQSDSVSNAQEAVQSAQRIFALAQRAVWLLVALSVVLVAATIIVAARRWRAALVLGLGTAAMMIVLRTAVRRVTDEAPDLVIRPGAKAALDAMLGGASASLLRLAGIVLILALVTVAASLARTHWRRPDLVVVAAVLLGAVTVAVVGATIVGLLLGIAVAVGVVLLARWLLPPAQPRDEPHDVPPALVAPA